MPQSTVDLKAEQQASLARPRYPYSWAPRLFFRAMDLVTGRPTTLAKAKLLETLACIPYREWEIRQYGRMTRRYRDQAAVKEAVRVAAWGRDAQDNEYWHLLVIHEKMKEEGQQDPWYLIQPVPTLMVWTYVVIARALVWLNLRGAFLFNAEFEDHAEHEYAQLVADHPEWETQPVGSAVVREYGEFATWADVFRRIGLDERDHRNDSFAACGKPEFVVPYLGMPAAK